MFQHMGNAIRRFLRGRYGTDQLNNLLLLSAVALSLVNMVLSLFLYENRIFTSIISPAVYVLIVGLLGLNLFRALSRNIYKRQQENRRFRNFLGRLKDRKHRYYRCPECHQKVRVPKGKGRINIRCPKCGNKFLRKT